MVHVRLEEDWTDATTGMRHEAGQFVEVDASTLARLEGRGTVRDETVSNGKGAESEDSGVSAKSEVSAGSGEPIRFGEPYAGPTAPRPADGDAKPEGSPTAGHGHKGRTRADKAADAKSAGHREPAGKRGGGLGYAGPTTANPRYATGPRFCWETTGREF